MSAKKEDNIDKIKREEETFSIGILSDLFPEQNREK